MGSEAEGQAAGGGVAQARDTLSVVDNRTGREYEGTSLLWSRTDLATQLAK